MMPPPEVDIEENHCLTVCPDQLLQVLDIDGPLSLQLKDYEPRKQQRDMARDIIEAYNDRLITLIEAGTGTGKSLAYLIPAIFWALRFKEKTVISTNTINLQEQLLNKDIPLLLKALNVDLSAVIVKGMGNYVCLRKLYDARNELCLMPPKEQQELETIEQWSRNTKEGSRSTLPIVPSMAIWEKVGAETDTCTRSECGYFQDCFFFRARRRAANAQILIANHHLLCSDLAQRSEENPLEETAVLPPFSRLVVDEAHNIEDIATDFFAEQANQLGIMRSLARLGSDKHGESYGKLYLLKMALQDVYKHAIPTQVSSIIERLTLELPNVRKDILILCAGAFEALANFSQVLRPNSYEDNSLAGFKTRLLPPFLTHPLWQKEVVPRMKLLVDAMDQYTLAVHSLEKELLGVEHQKMQDATKILRFEIMAFSNRLSSANTVLKSFLLAEFPPSRVRWIELQNYRGQLNVSLIDADLDISEAMLKYFFKRFPTIVMCSATLTTNRQFDFYRKRLGLIPEKINEKKIKESIYDSPFDYDKQSLLVVPADLPEPSHPDFIASAAECIVHLLQASQGNAFVLFTSYSMLNTCYGLIAERLRKQRYHLLKQGDNNRQALLQQFKKMDRSVLFGTDSFWEGVDVAGEALRCVIIVKLPFKVPTEPIIQARSEAIAMRGGDPFNEYSLPHAVVKFKQGFGRLIRNKRDRGCIVCLDRRILSKGYGKLFLDSLPPCQRLFASSEETYRQMTDFYRRTYHLVHHVV